MFKPRIPPRVDVWVVVSVDEASDTLMLRSPLDHTQTREFRLSEWGGAGLPQVGALVRSFIAVEPDVERLRLTQWLRRLKERCTAAQGLTPRLVRQALEANCPEFLAHFEQPRPVADFKTFLMRLAHTEGKGRQDHWLYAEDWRWDRDRTARAFEQLLGLPPGRVVPEPESAEEPLGIYADRCNQSAEALGLEKRLFPIGPAGDDSVFLALEPYVFHELVYRGLVVPK